MILNMNMKLNLLRYWFYHFGQVTSFRAIIYIVNCETSSKFPPDLSGDKTKILLDKSGHQSVIFEKHA